MINFFEWLRHDAPDLLQEIAVIVLFSSFTATVVISILAIISGYWYVTLFIWIVAPSALIVWAYLKEKDKTDE